MSSLPALTACAFITTTSHPSLEAGPRHPALPQLVVWLDDTESLFGRKKADAFPNVASALPLCACSQRRASVLQWNPEVATQLIVASDDDRSPTLQVSLIGLLQSLCTIWGKCVGIQSCMQTREWVQGLKVVTQGVGA